MYNLIIKNGILDDILNQQKLNTLHICIFTSIAFFNSYKNEYDVNVTFMHLGQLIIKTLL